MKANLMSKSNIYGKHFLYFALILLSFSHIQAGNSKNLIQNGDLTCLKKMTAKKVICNNENFTVGKLKAKQVSAESLTSESLRVKTLETSMIIPNNKDSVLQVNKLK